MMQSFYWNCPREDGKEFKWWNHIRSKVPELAATGITSLWLPPVHKAANLAGPSMGYDPYDYYDLGEFNQKGAVPTWFGTKQELLDLIQVAHKHGMTAIATMVLNHNSGADAQERNPLTGVEGWTLFQPRSGKFARNWESFHPNRYESRDGEPSPGMPILSHQNPLVFREILEMARWLVEEIGLDGFCYDFASGYGAATLSAIQEYRYLRSGKPVIPWGVAELLDNDQTRVGPVSTISPSKNKPASAFDLHLCAMLKSLCDQYGFSLQALANLETGVRKQPQSAVTFVDINVRAEEGSSITNDKLLAYSYILTHAGQPCIFWKDYFNYALGMGGTPHGIDTLVRTHRDYAGGETEILHTDDDLYIMQRTGHGQAPGLVYVLNNRGLGWNGTWVKTCWPATTFVPAAWWSRTDLNRPADQETGPDGQGQFHAPPRGYVVYVPRR